MSTRSSAEDLTASRSPQLAAVGRALPPHFASQTALTEKLRALWASAHFNPARLEDFHQAVGVDGRYLALPLDAYPALDGFAKNNAAWLEVAPQVGEAALRQALERAAVDPEQLDALFFVTVTGIATPTLDARLMNKMGLRPDLKRTPIFGLGCVAGAAGIARASDYLRGFPDHTAALLAVELCSLTLQRQDLSVPNMIASGLFGDGAAAVVLRGAAAAEAAGARGPRVLATRSVFYRDTERTMGWDIEDTGFKVILAANVPKLARARIGGDVDGFLADQGLDRRRIRHWIAHTGGPKVIEAFEEALELHDNQLVRTWASLKAVGNLSSASVLFVLGDLLEATVAGGGGPVAQAGDLGLLLAMGPGFCAELVLLQW